MHKGIGVLAQGTAAGVGKHSCGVLTPTLAGNCTTNYHQIVGGRAACYNRFVAGNSLYVTVVAQRHYNQLLQQTAFPKAS
jgi:hypothetical protein